MERAQEVVFQDLKNDSAMGKEETEVEVISDPDSTTNKGDPQSQRQQRQRRTTTARLPRDESAARREERKTTARLPRDESAARRKRKTTARLPRDESAGKNLSYCSPTKRRVSNWPPQKETARKKNEKSCASTEDKSGGCLLESSS